MSAHLALLEERIVDVVVEDVFESIHYPCGSIDPHRLLMLVDARGLVEVVPRSP